MGAKEDWIEIYDDYSAAELTAEITALKERLDNPYVNQSEGQRGYTRSINEDRARLAAAKQVQRGRSNSNHRRHGRADFSDFR